MPMTEAIEQTASSAIGLAYKSYLIKFATNVFPSSDGTWLGFARANTLATTTQYTLMGVTDVAGANKWRIERGSSAAQALQIVSTGGGTATIVGPAWTDITKVWCIAVVLDGAAGTLWWKQIDPAGAGVWSSATAANFLSGSWVPTQFGFWSSVGGAVNTFRGAQWGWRYWPKGNNPISAADFEVESRSLLPVRRGALGIWPMQRRDVVNIGTIAAPSEMPCLLDRSGNARHMARVGTIDPIISSGSVLSIRTGI